MNRVEGKRAIITGASRGLGRQLAIDFAREGAAGLVLVSRDEQSLKETQKLVAQMNPAIKVLVVLADLKPAR